MNSKTMEETKLNCPVKRLVSPVKRLAIAAKRLESPVCRLSTESIDGIVTSGHVNLEGAQAINVRNSISTQSPSTDHHFQSNVGFTHRVPQFTNISTGSDKLVFVENEATYVIKNGEDHLLFDGILTIEKKIRKLQEIFDQNGNAKDFSSSVQFEVAIHTDNYIFSGFVSLSDIDRGDFLRRLTDGEITLQPDSLAKKMFKILIAHKIKEKAYAIDTIFSKPGWKNLKGYGWIYATPKGIIGKPELPMCSCKDFTWGAWGQHYLGTNIAQDFLKMRRVLPANQSAAILFQYFFIISLLKGLLRSIEINPQFIIAIIGETNAKKTTLARFFFKLYNRSGGVDIDFTATRIALTEAMGQNADAVTIFDDITPPDSSSNARDLKAKLELITRGFGGNTPRKRSKAYVEANPGTTEFTPVLSSGVITGEIFPITLKSSRSRVVEVEIRRNDCDLNELTNQQNHPEVLPAFAEDFISFVTENIDNVLESVKSHFNALRFQNPLQLKTPRFAEDYALFYAVASVFSKYLFGKGNLSISESSNLINEDLKSIADILLRNDYESNTQPDEYLIAEAISSCFYNQQRSSKVPEPLERVIDLDEFIAIYPQYLIKICKEKYASNGRIFPFSSITELSKFLYSRDLIKVSQEGKKLRFTLKITQEYEKNSHRFYKFYKERMLDILENSAI